MGFEELQTNSRAGNILHNYLKNNHIPQSILFKGPPASPMEQFARAFAKAVNCTGESDQGFCGECQSCREIDKDISPDITILKPEGQFYKKDQITFLVNDNIKAPLKSSWKVYIIRDANRMNESSANALLKVLEEPSDTSLFILMTSNPEGLLQTIKSRCQTIGFVAPTVQEMVKIYESEGFNDQEAEILSHFGGFYGTLTLDKGRDLLMRRKSTVDMLVTMVKRSPETDFIRGFVNLSRSREKFLIYYRETVNLISLILRDIMLLQIDNDSDFIINTDLHKELTDLSYLIPEKRVLVMIERMEGLLRDIERNLNAKVLIQEFIRTFDNKENWNA